MNSATSGLTSAANDAANFVLIEEQIPILRRKDWRHRRARWWIFDQCRHRLALVRSKRSDVDQPGYFGIVARFSDDDATIGVADENDRPSAWQAPASLPPRHLPARRSGSGHRDSVAVFLEGFVDTLPAGTVYKASVDQNNIFHNCRGLCDMRASDAEHHCDDRQKSENDMSCLELNCCLYFVIAISS